MTSHIAQGATKILFHEICLRMQQQQQQSKVCLSLKVYFSPEINQIALALPGEWLRHVCERMRWDWDRVRQRNDVK